MRTAVIILCLLSILMLFGTAGLGMALRAGNEGVRKAHFHMAISTAVISAVTHLLAFIYILKHKATAPAQA